MEKHGKENFPQPRKGLPKIWEEWKERAVSQISRAPYPHFLALQPERYKTLRGSTVDGGPPRYRS